MTFCPTSTHPPTHTTPQLAAQASEPGGAGLQHVLAAMEGGAMLCVLRASGEPRTARHPCRRPGPAVPCECAQQFVAGQVIRRACPPFQHLLTPPTTPLQPRCTAPPTPPSAAPAGTASALHAS